MLQRIYLNNDWWFTPDFEKETYEPVRVPHTVCETPYHYFDESCYQMVSGYKRSIEWQEEWDGKQIFLTIDGAAHQAKVFLNDQLVGEHFCGYTAFTIDITSYLTTGKNELKIRLDSRESLNIPPFGHVIDYMTYGGIYRDVYLEVKNPLHIKDVFIKTNRLNSETYDLVISQTLSKACMGKEVECVFTVTDLQLKEAVMTWKENFLVKEEQIISSKRIEKIFEWNIKNPELYELKIQLKENGQFLDTVRERFGFRKILMQADGCYLNGEKVKIRGLNRHQSYPYAGYAMPASMQKLDADILKYELGLNAVRTSHYPQSQDFIDRCDEIGLLVLTEIPGWQHIGDEQWKQQAIQNVKEMVTEYRNHPSIFLWGVRINESVDDDDFYERTNEAAHELDDTRPTGGVRCYKKSHLLEDVYTYNDFYHDGSNEGCESKRSVTSDMEKAYLITEYNGHMYPTKMFDCEEHRTGQMLRHAAVLNSIAANHDIAGGFGWCAFDYNTHKDFGSGDRICYHGVMDLFRNPKPSAAIYACQSNERNVLELSSSMDIGEHPACIRNEIYLLTNADSVKMYRNGCFIKEYQASDSKFSHLKHGPILIDDYIGKRLEQEEGYSTKKSEAVKKVLHEAARYGMNHLSKSAMLTAAKLMVMEKMNFAEATRLYSTYIGDWGGTSTTYRFEAILDGKVVKTLVKTPGTVVHLQTNCSTHILKETKSYDVAEIRLKAIDENQNQLYFYQEPVQVETEGVIELIGPSVIGLAGGASGIYIKTIGKEGNGSVSMTLNNGETVKETFYVICE